MDADTKHPIDEMVDDTANTILDGALVLMVGTWTLLDAASEKKSPTDILTQRGVSAIQGHPG
jgi:hypothetical protein